MQSRRESAAEATVNVASGYALAVAVTWLVSELHGLQLDLGENLILTSWMTVTSLVHIYAIRRFFEAVERWKKRSSDNM